MIEAAFSTLVYIGAAMFIYNAMNNVFVIFGGARFVDKYFIGELSLWDENYSHDYYWRFYFQYSHRYTWGILRPDMPLAVRIWLVISYISYIFSISLLIVGAFLNQFYPDLI